MAIPVRQRRRERAKRHEDELLETNRIIIASLAKIK
jgi:hypothetical protein